jgi:hypothetical protein
MVVEEAHSIVEKMDLSLHAPQDYHFP